MRPHPVGVQIEASYRSRVEPKALRQAAEATLRHQQVEAPYELVVVATDDTTLRELNRRHRGIDAPTDVLAFPQQPKGPASFGAVDSGGLQVDGVNPHYLGDIIVSLPQAEAQAVEAGNTLQAELQLLVIHGVLHLVGHEDETEPERGRMWQAQQDIVAEMGLDVHLPD